MNRRFVSVILAITLVIAVASYLPRSVRGNGDMIEEDRPVRNFNEITLSTRGTLIVTYGEETALRIEGESNIIDAIETQVRANELTIRAPTRRLLNPTEPITYYVTVTELEELRLTDSGNLQADTITHDDSFEITITGSGGMLLGAVQVEALDIRITGSGDLQITTLTTDDLEINQTGSGDLMIESGIVDVQDVTITGSGNYDASGVSNRDAEIRLTGSGSARVQVTEDLEASLSGSGNVYYSGSPAVNERSTGSGEIIQQDS